MLTDPRGCRSNQGRETGGQFRPKKANSTKVEDAKPMDLNQTFVRRRPPAASRATGGRLRVRRWGRRSGKIARLPVEVGTVVRLFSAHSLAEERASCSP